MTPLALLPPIKLIVEALKPVLIFIHDTLGVSWGFSIVLLTVCVRAAMAPLTVKQFKSMQAMVRVAPQLKELQAKYKDDKQRQQQEVMKFYAENKINPFASCLPLVAQLPFFIGLFYLLQSDLRNEICGQTAKACGLIPGATGEKFLFVPDLTNKAHGLVLVVLIVLYIGSQLLSSLLTPSTGDRNQRMLMLGLPFVFTFFILRFPAGLIVYWITTNLWTVGQGYLLRRKMGPISAPKTAMAGDSILGGLGGGGTGAGGLSGMLAKLTNGTGASSKDTAPVGAASKGSRAKGAAVKGGAAKGAGTKGAATAEKPKPSGPPPRPPRQKKKRSGRPR
ncbi:MAG: YidC/Oxa1 family rane protein insertase [Solirubrobacteraceae bacterium]|jgi:YidC/Oxa1 family membrane protein insertase|nr:YidC/Oxa1 family rane protein insertase [Solirubrobacteraceae bacterium]